MKLIVVVLLLSGLATGAFALDFRKVGAISVSYHVRDIKSSNARMDSAGTQAPIDFKAFGSVALLQFPSIFLRINGGIGPVITDILQFGFQPEQIVSGNLLSKQEFTIMKTRARRAADESILDRIFELSSHFGVRL